MADLFKMGIGSQVHYIPLYRHPYYEGLGYQAGLCPNSERFYEEEMCLPMHPHMTDADVDGAHIRTLLLTLFFRYFPELIEGGHLYIAQPPLFKMTKGKDIRYAFTDAERNAILKEWGVEDQGVENVDEPEEDTGEATEEGEETEKVEKETKKKAPRVSLQRYKGLGEMNADQLWDTTMDPESRTMLQVTMDDVERADAVFTTLMGSEVAPRRKFIQTHAKTVKNLDV